MSDDLVKRLRTPIGYQDIPFIQEEAAARIEELKVKNEHAWNIVAKGDADVIRAMSCITELESKLEKAVKAFIVYEKATREFATSTDDAADEAEDFLDRDGGKLARSILALIEKDKTDE